MTDHLNDLFARTSAPALPDEEADRLQRVLRIEHVATAMLRDERASRADELWLASALLSFLEVGGDLEGQHLRIRPRRGSKNTARRLLETGRHRDDDAE